MKWIWRLLVLIIAEKTSGQIRPLDSLRMELRQANQDSDKVIIMAKMVDIFGFFNADSSFLYAQKALSISRNANYLYGEYLIYSRLFTAYNMIGDYAGALETSIQSLKVAERLTSRRLETMADEYVHFGHINREMEKYSEALGNYTKAMELRKQAGQPLTRLAGNYMDVAYCLAKLNKFDSAKSWADTANALHLQANNHWVMSLTGYGRIQEVIGNKALAESYYKEGIRKYFTKPQRDNGYFVTATYIDLARLLFKLSKYDSSIYFAQLAFQMSKNNRFLEYVFGAATVLADVYKAKKNADSAVKYLNAVIESNKSIFSQSKVQRFESVRFAEEQRKAEILAAEDKVRSKAILYSLLAGFVVLGVIAFILLRNNQQKQRTNAQLQRQKLEIENALSDLHATQNQLIQSEKMASLGELTAGIAHEIQNPLNFVNNFSELNVELIGEMEKELKGGNQDGVMAMVTDIRQNMERINQHGKRAEGIVTGMLQHSRTTPGHKEPTDINALVDEYLRLSFHGMKAKDNSFQCEIRQDLDPTIGKLNIVPQDLARALLNIYNNAFFSVSEKKKKTLMPPTGVENNGREFAYEPSLIVTTKYNSPPPAGGVGSAVGAIEIRIKDNGLGIPKKAVDKIFQPFFTTKPTGQGTGLGLSLSYDIITKEHNGQITVKTEEGEYAEFLISLPENRINSIRCAV